MKAVILAILLFVPVLALSVEDEIEKTTTDEAVIVKGKEKTLTLPMGASRILQFPFAVGPVNLGDETILKYERYKEKGVPEITKLMLTPRLQELRI